jgi:hypothetical protein
MSLKHYDNEKAQERYLMNLVEEGARYTENLRLDRTPNTIQDAIKYLHGEYMDEEDFKDTVFRLYGDRL